MLIFFYLPFVSPSSYLFLPSFVLFSLPCPHFLLFIILSSTSLFHPSIFLALFILLFCVPSLLIAFSTQKLLFDSFSFPCWSTFVSIPSLCLLDTNFLPFLFSPMPWLLFLSCVPSLPVAYSISLACALSTPLFQHPNTSSSLRLVSAPLWNVGKCLLVQVSVPGGSWKQFIHNAGPADRPARRPHTVCMPASSSTLHQTEMSPSGTAGPCSCALQTVRQTWRRHAIGARLFYSRFVASCC